MSQVPTVAKIVGDRLKSSHRLMKLIIPIWDDNNLQESLKTIGYLKLPSSKGEIAFYLIDFIYILIFMARTFILTVVPSPFWEKIMCYGSEQPQVFKVAQICAALAYIEVLAVRLWFYKRTTMKDGLESIELLERFNPRHSKWLMRLLKFTGINCTMMATIMFSLVSRWHFHQSEPNDYVAYAGTAFWTAAFIFYTRMHTYDMLVTYATAVVINIVIFKEMKLFNRSLDAIKTHKKLVQDYLVVAHHVFISRDLVEVITSLNGLAVIPFCGITISQLYLDSGDEQSQLMRKFLIIIGFAYTSRGYLLIAFCSQLFSLSMRVRDHILSLMANGNRSLQMKRAMLFIIEDIASEYNSLIYTDSNDGKVDQLDLVSNCFATLEFFMLFISFRSRVF